MGDIADDMDDRIEDTKDKVDDEFHELKGPAQQKKEDIQDETNE